MAKELTILIPDSQGAFSLEKVARSNLARIDIADVDLILTTKDGTQYILPNGGIEAMGAQPPKIIFSDTQITLDQLLAEVGAITDISSDKSSPTTQTLAQSLEEIEKKEQEQKELQEKLEKIEKDLETKQAEAEKTAEEFEKYKQEHEKDFDKSPVTSNTESAVEKMVEAAKKIEENIHRSDKDFSEPVTFQPPPAPFAASPGVPPPISLTPIVTISLGNVVGTTVVGNNIYGGGGAEGSEASAYIAARDPRQFSAATILGTSGNDVIYTDGPLVGNSNPSVDRSNNAKEFLLNVAGYFTQLNAVTISGVPAGVSFIGASDNGNGSWSIPAASVTGDQPITMIYNMNTWRSMSNTFDLEFAVSGLSTRGVTFQTVQSFRFMYVDVTDVSQVTDSSLVYESRGALKQIYVLPTLSQPSIIDSGEGDDIIYGGLNKDTITTGNGNNEIYAGQGDDDITTGNGNNTISLGAGNNTSVSGSGNDTITAIDGNNIIAAGNGTNSVTVGNGINSITTGLGNDTIVSGTGAVTIVAGDGVNIITANGGAVNITSGSGADQITANGGGGIIIAGDGGNVINVTTGNYSITAGVGNDNITAGNGNNTINAGNGTNTIGAGNGDNVIIAGTGNDTVTAGNGNNTFRTGLGTNSITAGTGNNTIDYSIITTTAAIISLTAGTATGTGLSDSFTNIQNAIGGGMGDTITGTTGNNTIRGGTGNDNITGNNGNDILYGDDGDDTITGGTGDDIIYGGTGNNTIYTGTLGFDYLYGGSGNNTFISQHAGVRYNGTNGADLLPGQINTIDYSAASGAMTINLQSGTGSGSLAQGDIYTFAATSGFSTINRILGGVGADVITGSRSNDYLLGNGGDDTLDGGEGINTLDGGAGNNTFVMGLGADTVIANTAGSDTVRYSASGAGIVVNLDNISHNFVNSLGNTITVAAYTGSNKGVTAADSNSYSTGDTYTAVSGTLTSINVLIGSAFGDIVYGGSDTLQYQTGNGNDFYFGGSGGETITYSSGNDRINGGGGTDVFWAASPNGGSYSTNTFMYLDAFADTNGNSIADYIDRGVGSLTDNGVTYTGFALGRNTTLLLNIENLVGEASDDYLVGNNSDNVLNGRQGNNTLFGMGGNDTLHAAAGSNIIDGGLGTDTVDFSNSYFGAGTTTVAYVFFGDATFYGASDKSYFLGGTIPFQARTGTATFHTITGVENITGSGLNDVLYGDSSANTIRAGAGNDIIAGNGGADVLLGENGDDVFLATAAQVAAASSFSGGGGVDTIRAAGLALTAGTISNSKYLNIEELDVRNSASGGTYSLTANDITNINDNTTSSAITLRIDTGDTFTVSTGAGTGAAASSVAFSAGNHTTYHYFSDAGMTTRVAIIDVYTGT